MCTGLSTARVVNQFLEWRGYNGPLPEGTLYSEVLSEWLDRDDLEMWEDDEWRGYYEDLLSGALACEGNAKGGKENVPDPAFRVGARGIVTTRMMTFDDNDDDDHRGGSDTSG
jgi:hypothetical protein